MNQKLQDSLAEVATFLLQWAKETKDFVSEQAPLVVREAIAYGRALETWESAALLIGLITGLVFLKRNYNKAGFGLQVSSHDIKTVAGFILTAVGGVGTLIQTPDLIKVWFAPRIYLLEWAAELLKTVKP